MLYFFKLSISKKYIKHLLIIPILTTTLSAIEIVNLSHAVDVAGKQRMFTQRMLKDYTMLGMENSFGNPDEDLKKIVEAFENHLQSLHDYTENEEIKKSTDEVKKIWIPIKEVLKEKPNKENVAKLQDDLEKLLKESNHATVLFAESTGKKLGEIINISGRQRMLSQRMASLYILKVWGINNENFKTKMDNSMALFKSSLIKLQQSELNTDEIQKLLDKVERSFMFFEVMNRSSNTFIPALIYKKSDDILKNMNTVTGLYVDVSKNKTKGGEDDNSSKN